MNNTNINPIASIGDNSTPFNANAGNTRRARPKRILNVVGAKDFLDMDIPEREVILEPIITRQSLIMLHAWRGLGKTLTTLGIALAIANGKSFLKWRATKPHRVIYIDGEMPANQMQNRIKKILKSMGVSEHNNDYFKLLTPDFQDMGMPDISTQEGQDELYNLSSFRDAEVVVIDNLSTLCRTGKENEESSWNSVQSLILRLRKEGKAVLIVHHSGKGGGQRGTSKKEDILDTVITLKRPEDYTASEGARFKVEFEKARNLMGDDADTFEVNVINNPDGSLDWEYNEVVNEMAYNILEAYQELGSIRKAAKELNISTSTAHKYVNEAKEAGKI